MNSCAAINKQIDINVSLQIDFFLLDFLGMCVRYSTEIDKSNRLRNLIENKLKSYEFSNKNK